MRARRADSASTAFGKITAVYGQIDENGSSVRKWSARKMSITDKMGKNGRLSVKIQTFRTRFYGQISQKRHFVRNQGLANCLSERCEALHFAKRVSCIKTKKMLGKTCRKSTVFVRHLIQERHGNFSKALNQWLIKSKFHCNDRSHAERFEH